MYLLFVDESGTHGGSHSFVLGGLAIHEQDAARLNAALDRLVERSTTGQAGGPEDYELHAAEMRNAKPSATRPGRPVSPWAALSRARRQEILLAAYDEIALFAPLDPSLPPSLFGVVVDRRFRSGRPVVERERFAYEVLLTKFDAMLGRTRRSVDSTRGWWSTIGGSSPIVDIQEWTRQWQRAAGTLPPIRNLADVPFFADSRASRLLQAADLVSYALYRHYDPARTGSDYVRPLWTLFDAAAGVLHGCVHYTPSFGSNACACRPCTSRAQVWPDGMLRAFGSVEDGGHEWDGDPAGWVQQQRAAEVRGR